MLRESPSGGRHARVNAAMTLQRTVSEIDTDVIDEILVVDDASTDSTTDEAHRLGLPVELHERNRGYGGCQKTCYTKALEHDADVVVMVHPDYQYSPAWSRRWQR